MPFDLHISVRKRPHHDEPVPPASARTISLEVNGTFTSAGEAELERVVSECFSEGADSVLVEFEDVIAVEHLPLERFASRLMTERAAGHEVQVLVRDPGLHATCVELERSPDWLIASMTDDVSGARRSIYVEGTE